MPSSSAGWTVAALAAVAALYMSSRSSGREHEQVQTRDAELEASAPTRGLFDESALKPAAAGELGGLWSAEARVRTLCVALLCMQYAAYALLRRYSTGILKVRAAEGIQGAARNPDTRRVPSWRAWRACRLAGWHGRVSSARPAAQACAPNGPPSGE